MRRASGAHFEPVSAPVWPKMICACRAYQPPNSLLNSRLTDASAFGTMPWITARAHARFRTRSRRRRNRHFRYSGWDYPTPTSINDVGEITGNVYVPDIGDTAGFFRDASGQATTFSVPGDVYGTFPVSLNKTGQILGYIVVNGFGSEGFIRDRSGTVTVFDAPHSACNPGLARTKGPLEENDLQRF